MKFNNLKSILNILLKFHFMCLGDLLKLVTVLPIHFHCTQKLDKEGVGFPKIGAMDGFEPQ